MIKFSLKCDSGHRFESWFQSGAAFERLHGSALVSCPVCASTQVAKDVMAPALATRARPAAAAPAAAADPAPDPDAVQARLSALRALIEKDSDYVGDRFATEARAMYLGDIPSRPIHGEARPAEARSLIEDGVPVLPLPFIPSRKAN